ncbi:hypothetical protein RclHR1_01830008 [Rhizophagus clarus]|uniref:Uncharacterized protein n=1 Tax=Rhizophagus clarus TaxID=94130 RepID=A0A2Z6QZF9_9GLOM|nr:hypothetical protein RclHR1_01830008 [Rhizophagus clarus]
MIGVTPMQQQYTEDMSHLTTHATAKNKKRKSSLSSSNPHGNKNNVELKTNTTYDNGSITMEGITPIPSVSTSSPAVVTDLINLEVGFSQDRTNLNSQDTTLRHHSRYFDDL